MLDLLLLGTEPAKQPLLEIFVTETVIEQKVELPEPIPINDPNNCEPAMYWAKEAPYYCIPKPTEKRSESVVPASSTRTSVSARGSATGNLYAPGNCTFFAKSMRPDLPNNLGNANTWVKRASAQGFATGSIPKVKAIGQKANHVVYVTGVNNDGTFNLAEWNYRNLYERTDRTVSASGWKFIY